MITYQTEKLDAWIPDATPLFPLHYEELALNKDKIKLSLSFDRYREMENMKALHIATVRNDGKLVGYFITFLLPHLHYKDAGTMAYTDMYFILPEFRVGGVGARLLTFVESCWKELGATKAYLSCKAHQNHSTMFEMLGFQLSDYMFTKVL